MKLSKAVFSTNKKIHSLCLRAIFPLVAAVVYLIVNSSVQAERGFIVSAPVTPRMSPPVRELPPYQPEIPLITRDINPRLNYNR